MIEGFVQFIDSQPLQKILERNRTIRQYLQTKITQNNAEDATLMETGIPREMMDNYVKSCGMFNSFYSSESFQFCFQPDIVL